MTDKPTDAYTIAQTLEEIADIERDWGDAGLERRYRERAAEIRQVANKAARREAGEAKRTCGPEVYDAALKSLAEEHTAADLVARLRAMQHMDPCYPTPHPLCVEAAAAIEAMRAERDAVLSLIPPEFLDPPDGGEVKPVELVRHVVARVKALEGVLDKYRAGIVTHVQMTGPVFGGTNSRQLKIAFDADQALAAGGTDADERAKGGRNG